MIIEIRDFRFDLEMFLEVYCNLNVAMAVDRGYREGIERVLGDRREGVLGGVG